jgi:phosphoribosylanthranilate isomerase
LFVKICGITSVRDAQLAVDAGADAIGLNFYQKSSRYLTPAKARRIVEALPSFVWAVGIFVNESLEFVRDVTEVARLDVAQLHGDERPSYVKQLVGRTMKALHVDEAPALALARGYASVEALVLDAAQPGFGGGGLTFDWSLAKTLAAQRPILLAGGLTPANVARAVKAVRPFGVDVASGVESAPGIKDARKLAAFIRAARSSS